MRAGSLSVLLLAALVSSGCGHYAEFALPTPDPGGSAPVAWEWQLSGGPQIEPDAAGQWDSIDALNPSVVRRDGVYWNYYSGFDGTTWHTGLATSSDGLQWQKQGKVLSPQPGTWENGYIAANGSAMIVDSETLYWYQAGAKGATSIGLARSRDGRAFTKQPRPVLELGPRGSWDEVALGDPYVISVAGSFWMYYLGQDRARQQRLGVARSPDGVRWTKLRSNPILDLGDPGAFDENGLGEPAVWAFGGSWWMLYTGRDVREHRRIGLAHSRDGVHWDRTRFVFAGSQPWNSAVVCDPAVEPTPDGVRVWFGGGDVASPDENLHGRIGFTFLKPR